MRGALRVILACAVPSQERYIDGAGSSGESSHLLEIDAIHLRREVLHTPLEIHHMSWLRWIPEDVRVGAVKLGQLCHTDSDLRYTRTALAEKAISSEPWGNGPLLDILAETHINGVVVFGYIPIDVVESSVADLHVDVATEEQLLKAHEGGDTLFGASSEVG